MDLQQVRGTKDLLPEDFAKFNYIISHVHEISKLYGFKEMSVPIFEFTEVFKRTLGDYSDIVMKEMYTFCDRNEESITLRPEFTASIARAFISNHLEYKIPVKFFTTGPIFRYERPQKGRQRQFHQINCEFIGIADVYADAEIIAMAQHILDDLNISDVVTLHINSLGDYTSRTQYCQALIDYFTRYKNDLSKTNQTRLEKNPLRILDAKEDREIIDNAPQIPDYYTKDARKFFDKLLYTLDELKIAYTINTQLVRGLDYYCHTIFEFITNKLGAQGTIIAGGRYDKLIKMMNGPDMPAIGFAGGIERIAELIEAPHNEDIPVIFIPIGEPAYIKSIITAQLLRTQNIYADIIYQGNLQKKMKKATNAKITIIIGDNEIQNNTFTVKNMTDGHQESIDHDELIEYIKKLR